MAKKVQYILLCCYIVARVSASTSICGQCSDGNDPVPNPPSCRCDQACTYYGDCCENATTERALAEKSKSKQLSCVSTSPRDSFTPLHEGEAYWMITSCPDQWPTVDGGIARNCTKDVTAPPVTDLTTGSVFRNTYCAICNNVSLERIAVWRTRVYCMGTLDLTTATIENYTSSCSICQFEKPINEELEPRFCFPHVSSCPPQNLTTNLDSELDYSFIVDQCLEGHRSLVHLELYDPRDLLDGISLTIYKNEYCALCNGVPNEYLQCFNPTTLPVLDACLDYPILLPFIPPGTPTQPPPFSAFIDVTGSGTIVVSTENQEEVELVTCNSDEVFDPSIGCRKIVCPEGHTFTDSQCQPENGQPLHPNMTAPETINCTTIELDSSEYTKLSNESVLYQDQEVQVVGYSNTGQPIICTNFSQTGEVVTNTTVEVTGYPLEFLILTYIGSFFSILGSSAIILTYSLFKELRTLPSLILINLAVAFTVSDLFLLVGGSLAVPSSPSCTAVAIILHFFMLARFSWMSIMGFEVCRVLFMATRLHPEDSKHTKAKLLAVYMLVGWSLPLIITTATIITNYTTEGLVQYGEMEEDDSDTALCWINHSLSLVVAFLVPVGVAILLNTILFVASVALLCKASSTSVKSIRSTQGRNIRVIIAAFVTTGITWLFGILAIFNQAWAWYPFIVFNSSQAMLIALAFLLTRRVLHLYYTLLRRVCCTSVHQKPPQHDDSQSKTVSTANKYTSSSTGFQLQLQDGEGTVHSTLQEVEDEHDKDLSA